MEKHATAVETPDRIEGYLDRTGLAARRPRVVPLTPDASDRRYFRVMLDGADPIVIAVYSGAIDFGRMPFANVAELFRRMEVPAPAVLAHSDELGIVAQEDLGDVTLQAHLGAASITEHAALYREAVSLIHHLQSRGRSFASADFVPYTLAFDVEKLTFELDFFERHFLGGYRGIVLSPSEKAALGEEWAALAQEL